ncbi:hypothetical protein HK097_011623 [Rhizophlyctis rosea]|uniref:MYND-type domain-containing protein n=1 Tax=Rhizophlyctis rosea TaxID=64517 RepID=A0AAD5SI44_9FUNG|nr:hypothetical protein HK097_011623 [Rhizophlyctis rosea]
MSDFTTFSQLPPPVHTKVRELASQLRWSSDDTTTTHAQEDETPPVARGVRTSFAEKPRPASGGGDSFDSSDSSEEGDVQTSELDENPSAWLTEVKKKAQEGDARAQALFAVCLQTGSLTQRNEGEALRWLGLAASANGGPAPPPPPPANPPAGAPAPPIFGSPTKGGAVFTFGAPTFALATSPSRSQNASPPSDTPLSPPKSSPLKSSTTSATFEVTPPTTFSSTPPPSSISPSSDSDRYLGIICHLLGEWYRRGIGTPSNLNTAFKYLKRAADLGYEEGLNSLAGMHERGDGVIRDDAAAFALYSRSADGGNFLAQFKVGQAYEKGKGLWRIHEETALQEDNTENGMTTGTPINYYQAKRWYQKAAAQNYFPASVRLAILSLDPAYETIDNLLAAATTISTPRSLHDLAIAHSSTRHGANPSPKEMRQWLRRAAMAGHVRSQYMMGKIYQEGAPQGKQYVERAFYWYHKAALQGYQPAQWAVCGMYRVGHGVARDVVLADKWHRAANRCGCQRVRPDIQDYACTTILSLHEADGPTWNGLDQEKPFNLVSAANSSMDAKVLGASAPGASESVAALPVRFDVNSGTGSPASPSRARTPSTANGQQMAGYPADEAYDVENDGYRDMRALLDSMYLQKGSYLQERSTSFPTLMHLERYRETHAEAIARLCEVKRTFMHAENLCKAEKHEAAVRELARGFRAYEGLFDLGNYNLRLLAAVSVQTVLAKDPKNSDALLVDCFLNILSRPAELSIIALDKVLNAKNDEVAAYLLRGGCKAKLHRFMDALADYDAAAAADDPQAPTAEIYFQRGVCHSNIEGKEHRAKSMHDMAVYLTYVPLDGRRVPDAHYTIAGNLLAMDNTRKMVDHFSHALHSEGVRLPFYPSIINMELKTRLTLEVKYTLCVGGDAVRRQPWSKIPKKVLQNVEGDEPQSIAKECLACGSVGKTRTCQGCMAARYCSTNCQIAHWIRGHSAQCKKAEAPAAAG